MRRLVRPFGEGDIVRDPGFELSPSVEARRGGSEIIDELAGEWRELCERAQAGQPFYRPEWTKAYLHAFAPRAKLLVITARVAGSLRAVLPLVEEHGFFLGMPVVRLRGAANAHSCRFDMVQGAGAGAGAVLSAVWRFLEEMPGWDLIELPNVPAAGAIEALAELARANGFPVGRHGSMCCPYIPLAGLTDRDSLLLRTSANFRSNVRRKSRQLKARGELAPRLVTDASPEALQSFYDLERSGWKGKKGTAIDCHERTRRFYDEIAINAERFGYLSLWFLDFNGRPIAAQFGVTYAGRYFMPKLAFDEEFRQYGPGHLLIYEILRACVERGISEYDFTGPWAEYKAKWTSAGRPHSTFWIFRRSAWGRTLYTMKFKVEAGLKQTLRPWVRALEAK